ncbi:agglutinin-2-like [Glycine soja]|uniref:Agglutinin-2 n=1 Tax=Glycine soja TaxID=3848 RepID=A0A0B2SM37_GLYSO|nr:agglutinin-2-like [Glycine soja]KHN45307.1 Agglutinin-2 [Glycine soja]RZB99125.1 Agglutinin-2 [Glycine soja]
MAKSKTQTSFPTLLVFLCYVLLLNNVKKSNSLSFNFSNFVSGPNFDIGFLGDARPLDGAIQLTRRDNNGPYGTANIRQHSVGRAVYIPPVRLWDKTTGKLADFETDFSFVVDYYSAGSQIHADGLSFFIIPFGADPRIPKNSSGGYLGLFSPETAFNAYKNQIVAVEFDSFRNEWDPEPVPVAPHIGIDINSLESVETTDWPINSVPQGAVGKAIISYDSNAKKLYVAVGYDTQPPTIVALSQTIDLRVVLPEWVRIGFSGATGDMVETHDILSWSFTSHI